MILRRIFLQLKGLRFIALVPPIVLNVVTPLTFIPLLYTYGKGDEALYALILEFSQTIFPFFSVWWIIFISREYIESDGNELLFVFKPRTKLCEYLILFSFYLLNALILFVLLTSLYPNILHEYVRLLCICLMFFGITYVLMYTTSSISLTLMVTLVYSLIAMVIPDHKMNAIFYRSSLYFDSSIFTKVCIPQLIISGVLITVGYFANKRYAKYK